MAYITVRTNGQTLTVNASVSHWTSAALAVVASGDDDVESTTTTTATSDYTMHFANTATTATITVKQLDGTTLLAQTFEVHPGVGPRVLNPVPDQYQAAADVARRDLPLAPAGAIAETFSRAGAVMSNQGILSSARLHLHAIHLSAGTVISSASFMAGTTAAGTPTHQWFALYDSALGLIGQTGNDTSEAWTANTVKTLAFATPLTTTYSGLHYLGILVTASTPPSLIGQANLAVATGVAPTIGGHSTTGLVGTAPPTAATITATAPQPWAYVS